MSTIAPIIFLYSLLTNTKKDKMCSVVHNKFLLLLLIINEKDCKQLLSLRIQHRVYTAVSLIARLSNNFEFFFPEISKLMNLLDWII